MIDWKIEFLGLIVTGYYKFVTKRKGSDDEEKSFDPFKLIPSYTITPISMKFGA